MKRLVFKARFLWLVALAMLAGAWPVGAQAAAPPGPADNYAVLAGSALTCTDSNVNGLTGIASSFVVASTRCSMPVRVDAAAYKDFTDRYGVIKGSVGCPQDHILTGTLAGQTLQPGTYCFTAAAALTGTLHLTGGGPWLFEIGTVGGALTANSFTVVSDNPCATSWWVRDDVTMTTSAFQGIILGGGAITLTGTSLAGNAWATGAMSMTGSHITGCASIPAGTTPGCLAAQQALDVAKAQDVTEDAAERAADKKHGKGNDDEDKKGDHDKADRGSHESNAAKKEDRAENAMMRSLEKAVRKACSSDDEDDD